MAHLREACDELRRQVQQLESQPPAAENSSEETAELQRRFEMAVEDLRQLKREKAQLEEQLAGASPMAAPVGDENDWEAQKRRLLASLEDEALEGQMSPERQQQRATIEGTISITDEVIAGKDEVIAELRRRLASAPDSGAEAAVVIDHAFDDDERLENERARLAELEGQLREKLRQSELELSVERAKLSRQQTELERKRIDLEALRGSHPGPRSDAHRRRRQAAEQLAEEARPRRRRGYGSQPRCQIGSGSAPLSAGTLPTRHIWQPPRCTTSGATGLRAATYATWGVWRTSCFLEGGPGAPPARGRQSPHKYPAAALAADPSPQVLLQER